MCRVRGRVYAARPARGQVGASAGRSARAGGTDLPRLARVPTHPAVVAVSLQVHTSGSTAGESLLAGADAGHARHADVTRISACSAVRWVLGQRNARARAKRLPGRTDALGAWLSTGIVTGLPTGIVTGLSTGIVSALGGLAAARGSDASSCHHRAHPESCSNHRTFTNHKYGLPAKRLQRPHHSLCQTVRDATEARSLPPRLDHSSPPGRPCSPQRVLRNPGTDVDGGAHFGEPIGRIGGIVRQGPRSATPHTSHRPLPDLPRWRLDSSALGSCVLCKKLRF